jgi:hypothetical protein
MRPQLSVISEAGVSHMESTEDQLRAIVLETMAQAGYGPRSSGSARAYRKRTPGEEDAVPTPAKVVSLDTACLTVAQVMEELKLGERRVRELIAGGEISSFTISDGSGSPDRRVRRSDLAQWIQSRIEAA